MKFKGLLAVLTIAAFTFALPVSLMVVGGCAKTSSQQRTTVNTIATLGYTADASFKSYLDLVVSGKISTNSVPDVSRSYSVFQSAYLSALTFSAMNTNAPPSVDLLNAASQLQLTITAAQTK